MRYNHNYVAVAHCMIIIIFLKSYAGIFARGVCMGIADLIPGVSGGTIAFISGIYSRLLAAIGAFSSPSMFAELFKLQLSAMWRRADGAFLVSLFAGIAVAVVVFGDLLHYLLSAHPHLLLAFFCGLILTSLVMLLRQLRVVRRRHIIVFGVGTAVAFAVVSLPATTVAPSLPIIFIGGAIAICAMLLPGISGSYILLIIGLYAHIIDALHARDFLTLVVFAAGCGIGILAFARALSFLMRRFYDDMLVLLGGVMLGALPKLWPWKAQAEGVKIILQPNVLPSAFAADAQIGAVITLAGVGAAAMWGISAAANRAPHD